MRLFFLLFGFQLLFINKAVASDSLVVKQLMERIRYQQVHADSYFPKGLFPSYRAYYYNRGTLKKDDNSFFTGLVVYTLKQLYPFLDTSSRAICNSIINSARPAFVRFKNRKGKNIYSFWQTRPVKYFPNSTFLSLFKSNALPDDADCSVITLMALGEQRSTAADVHAYMQDYTNTKKHKVQSTFAAYKKLPAYSTWLSHKVPIDFDVCVLSNILSFVHTYNLQYTKADSASLQLICQMVQKRQYKTDGVYLSPYYNKTSVILYHLARLMSTRNIPVLEQYRLQLIDDAWECFEKSDNHMEKVILSTALLKWNVEMPEPDHDLLLYSQAMQKNFVFFVANMASMLPNPFKRLLAQSNIGRFDYYCPAYNDVLLLEYLVLRSNIRKQL